MKEQKLIREGEEKEKLGWGRSGQGLCGHQQQHQNGQAPD